MLVLSITNQESCQLKVGGWRQAMNARHIQCLMTELTYGIHSYEIHGHRSDLTVPVGPLPVM